MLQVYLRTLIRSLFLLSLCMLFWGSLIAQQNGPTDFPQPLYWQTGAHSNAPLLVMIMAEEMFQKSSIECAAHQQEYGYNLLIIADTISVANYCRLVNKVLNDESIDKKKIYLLSILAPAQKAQFNIVDHRIYAASQWLDQQEVTANSLADALRSSWSSMKTQSLWTFDVEKIEATADLMERPERILRGIGINLGTTSNRYRTLEAIEGMPKGLRTIGFEGFRQAYPRCLLNFSLDIGIALPDPEELIQSQITEQIDISALLNGDEIELELNALLSGYLSGSVGVGLDYLFPTTKRTQAYAGLGLKFFGGNFFSGRIDTTIVLDPNNGIGTNRDNLNFRDQADGFSRSTFYYFTLSPKIGVFRKFNERWVFDLSAQYSLDPATLKNESNHFSFLHLKMGLKYRFTGRAKTRYKYLKIAAIP